MRLADPVAAWGVMLPDRHKTGLLSPARHKQHVLSLCAQCSHCVHGPRSQRVSQITKVAGTLTSLVILSHTPYHIKSHPSLSLLC